MRSVRLFRVTMIDSPVLLTLSNKRKHVSLNFDMGIVSAIASSFLDRPIQDRSVVLGEVGLTGEVRAISQVEVRVTEMKKMGFTRCLIPESNLKRLPRQDGIELIGITTVSVAMEVLF